MAGSRQFKDFEEYLIPPAAFEPLWAQGPLPPAVTLDFDAFWQERQARLERELTQVNRLAERGELPDAEIRHGHLKVTPLTHAVPAEAEALNRPAYELLPTLKITDLLLEVDQWIDLTQQFTHLKSGQPPKAKDHALLLTAILADAINLGLRKMASACPGVSYAQLTWMAAWHLRDETYSRAPRSPTTNSGNPWRRCGVRGPPTLTGDYLWQANRRVARGRFRPLRQPHDRAQEWFRPTQAPGVA